MNRNAILAGIFVIFMLVGSTIGFGAIYDVNYTSPSMSKMQNAQFFVKTLKYEPYPVNPGDSFDIWIKVQNIGETDAKDASFELQLDSPFSSADNLTSDFGSVSGTRSATLNMRSDETTPQENEIVLKYRIDVAADASEGTHTIKLIAYPDKSTKNIFYKYDLPVNVQNTKTTLDVVMQDSSYKKTVFGITNTGDKLASGITVSIPDYDNTLVTGIKSIMIGNLAPGDFTTVSFELNPNPTITSVPIQLSYTDTAGLRSSTQKSVPVRLDDSQSTQLQPAFSAKSFAAQINWMVYMIGMIFGIVIASIAYSLMRKKEK